MSEDSPWTHFIGLSVTKWLIKAFFLIPILFPAGISSPFQQIAKQTVQACKKKKSTKMKYAVKMFEMSQTAAANEPVLVPKLMQFI